MKLKTKETKSVNESEPLYVQTENGTKQIPGDSDSLDAAIAAGVFQSALRSKGFADTSD